MAFGKGRTNKRSSSSSSSSSASTASYASTITIIVFIALCVLGVWMLTSNSVMPPQTTTRTMTTTNSDKRTSPPFEDNPGELPEDAIRSDGGKETSSQEKEKVPAEEVSNEPKQQQTDESRDETGTEPEPEPETRNVKERQSEVEKAQKKQKENENQTSDESSVTQNQQTEQDDHDNQSVTETAAETETNTEKENETKKTTSSKDDQNSNQNENTPLDTDNQTSEEDRTRIIQQQQQDLIEDSIITDTTPPVTPSTESQFSPEENQPKTDETTTTMSSTQSETGSQQKTTNETTTTSSTQSKTGSQQKPTDETTATSSTQSEMGSQQKPTDETTTTSSNQSETGSQRKTNDTTTATSTQSETESQQKQNNPDEEPTNPNNPEQETTKENTMTSDTDKTTDSNSKPTISFPNGENSGIPKESKESKRSWSTQADQSENEKERRRDGTSASNDASIYGYTWQLCNVTAGYDYIPCLDNEKAIKQLRSTKHYEHRERHCPEVGPTCLVPTPEGYKIPIKWPQSRDKIWYHNVPHTKLAEVKGHQNWVKVTGEFLTFPGGGTQFIHGALHYVNFVEQSVPIIAWGKHTRVILDVGCGVASFGGYLFERGVLTMSLAPKDEHEAQVQFALERGIPAISAVMGSQRLPFPSRVFDLIHCARCRVPWHENGGALLLELNRVLRPGGYFVWSATPVYQKLEEDIEIWNAMSKLTVSICWELVTIQKDRLNSAGAAIYRKPDTNDCYDQRKQNRPPMCKNDDDSNAAWYVPLQACMHRAPVSAIERGSRWPEEWPKRVQTPPYWLNSSQMGIYGKPAPTDFATDYEHWKRVVKNLYLNGLGISWDNVRNVMDMRAVYGGFAAALKDLQVWVMNVVNVDSPDTLPIIYERGLFGIYHDWCESFSSYPRTYDLLHADHLFSIVKKRCKIAPLMAEIDRIVRPGGKLIVRDESSTVREVENMLKSLHWEVHLTFSKDQEGILSARKTEWRPDTYVLSS